MKLETFHHDDYKYNPEFVDSILLFINNNLHDENFSNEDFTQLYGEYALYKSIYVYYDNEKIVGVCACNFYKDENDDEIMYLMVIAIDKEYQNKGIGSIMLQKILSMNNQSVIWVKIHKENKQSEHFFKKNGFVKKSKKSMPNILNPSFRKPYNLFYHS